MTWAKSFNISNYVAGKTRAHVANSNRKMAQKLRLAQSKRSGAPVIKLNRHGKHK